MHPVRNFLKKNTRRKNICTHIYVEKKRAFAYFGGSTSNFFLASRLFYAWKPRIHVCMQENRSFFLSFRSCLSFSFLCQPLAAPSSFQSLSFFLSFFLSPSSLVSCCIYILDFYWEKLKCLQLYYSTHSAYRYVYSSTAYIPVESAYVRSPMMYLPLSLLLSFSPP